MTNDTTTDNLVERTPTLEHIEAASALIAGQRDAAEHLALAGAGLEDAAWRLRELAGVIDNRFDREVVLLVAGWLAEPEARG